MAQRIKVQDGIVVYESTDTTNNLDFSIKGKLGVKDSITVGNNLTSDGLLTTIPGANLEFKTTDGGRLILNGQKWPQNNGTAGQVLTTDGVDNLSWQTVSNATTNVIDLVSVSGIVYMDTALAINFRLVLTENCVLDAPISPTDGMVVNLVIRQPVSGGFTLGFPPCFSWPMGKPPLITIEPYGCDFISMFYDASVSKWICVMNFSFR